MFFNPAFTPTLTATLTQPLLNGFGLLPNTRYIIEQKNSIKVANSLFAQQVIAVVTQTSNDYWELVYDRENVKVQEAAVGVSQKLWEDNKKQLEIGTMAPLDVLTAESQLATDQQNLIVAQTTKLQQETVLLNDIAKNLLAKDVAGIEIVPTTPISIPDIVENIPLQDAVQEAWRKRPELYQADLNLKNSEIEVKVLRNALLPSLNAYVQYQSQGLNGTGFNTSEVSGSFVADTAAPLVDANGNVILIGGNPAFSGLPATTTTITHGGVGDALSQVFRNQYPVYSAGVTLTMPLRNRSAQADSARAQFDERQQRVQYRQTENTIVINVRNTMIALQQDRSQVAAAEKARNLAQQTLDAEQKKYQLGSSTSYQVVLRSRDLTSAARHGDARTSEPGGGAGEFQSGDGPHAGSAAHYGGGCDARRDDEGSADPRDARSWIDGGGEVKARPEPQAVVVVSRREPLLRIQGQRRVGGVADIVPSWGAASSAPTAVLAWLVGMVLFARLRVAATSVGALRGFCFLLLLFPCHKMKYGRAGRGVFACQARSWRSPPSCLKK